jgi:hypothetical protein
MEKNMLVSGTIQDDTDMFRLDMDIIRPTNQPRDLLSRITPVAAVVDSRRQDFRIA